ncbi:1-(5-phosphoribosyl)-5-[(5-phosphoribosylamino)methylideneamino] imidazole-4-carboxamide isomerase [Neisseria meningitidis]|nr:1-(5-phosphoribosyl)-5-[(5-phosphoribosylamino)methylideneamino] imidazole-4-carboxamide isomerase [Neisseria meningitidis]
MLLIPAIDLKEGHCVRLKQGLMEEATVFSDSPPKPRCTGSNRARAACIWWI